MKIQLTSGTGIGPTKLAAFDAALVDAGVHNYNILRLSSVVPPKSKIVKVDKYDAPKGEWGHRLYVVMAEMRVDTPNEEAWAGIGWVQDKKSGRGLFVEHEGKSKLSVKKDIEDSLKALLTNRGLNHEDYDIKMEVHGTVCSHDPVCALVVAVFQSQDWGLGLFK